MDLMRDWVDGINCHWVAMIAAGMYTHMREICVIGLCFEEGPIVHPSYSSLLFTFSILSVFAEHKPWPRSLKEPPVFLLYIYEMLVAALIANLSTRAIWTPLVHATWALTQESSKWLMWINSLMGLDHYSIIAYLANFMATDDAASYMTSCLSILSFVWMMDATESLDALLDLISK
ncbi:uncharacterized protein LOC103570952 [Microplitis demolitor]|uniref:uncharacterized protein LOC103570952 n=1 Tax=Microplitis demolitor TaxID=69319 RepID=UPI0004CDD29D|nr:uncharacterized protein LOC103570952 [Microplitis demolitor]